MWVLPKNYQLSCPFVADMVELKEDLKLLESNIESSLMWRSKPTQLRTWFQRWNRVSWMPHLFGRILKPCQWSRFEDELTLSLAATHANLSVSLEKEEQKKTKDISGLTSEKSSEQFDLFDVSLKTSKDTSTLDSEKSLATWKALITKRRGEYSARLKSAHLIREKGSSSWPTVRVSSANGASQKELSEGNPKRRLETEVLLWPTPTAHEARLGYQDRSDPTKKGTQESLTTVVVNRAGGRSECLGHLAPEFCEWLMGVPTGWTELDF